MSFFLLPSYFELMGGLASPLTRNNEDRYLGWFVKLRYKLDN